MNGNTRPTGRKGRSGMSEGRDAAGMHVAVVGYGQIARSHTRILAAEGHHLDWLIGRVPERTAAFAAGARLRPPLHPPGGRPGERERAGGDALHAQRAARGADGGLPGGGQARPGGDPPGDELRRGTGPGRVRPAQGADLDGGPHPPLPGGDAPGAGADRRRAPDAAQRGRPLHVPAPGERGRQRLRPLLDGQPPLAPRAARHGHGAVVPGGRSAGSDGGQRDAGPARPAPGDPPRPLPAPAHRARRPAADGSAWGRWPCPTTATSASTTTS